jgi:transcriptional regulator with XRE-family HTH domain
MDTNRNSELLGEKIRRLRQAKGIPQERLALLAKVDQSGLSKFERGQNERLGPTPLQRIATVLGISFEELIEGTTFTSLRNKS